MHLTVQVTGIDELQQKLKDMKKRSSDFSDVLMRVGKRIQKKTVNRILEGGIPPWVPSENPSNKHPLLQRTLRLLNSLQSPSAIEIDIDSVRFFTDVPYAVWQNYGTHAPTRIAHKFRKLGARSITGEASDGIPARKFMYLEQDDLDYFKKALVAYIVDGDTGL